MASFMCHHPHKNAKYTCKESVEAHKLQFLYSLAFPLLKVEFLPWNTWNQGKVSPSACFDGDPNLQELQEGACTWGRANSHLDSMDGEQSSEKVHQGFFCCFCTFYSPFYVAVASSTAPSTTFNNFPYLPSSDIFISQVLIFPSLIISLLFPLHFHSCTHI